MTNLRTTARMLPLTALLLGSTLAASVTQRQQHVNQVLIGMGLHIETCAMPVSDLSTYDTICAGATQSPTLFTQGWDLYADWSTKVTLTATQVSAWKTEGNTTVGAFRLADGDVYIVAYNTVLKQAVITWSDPVTGSRKADIGGARPTASATPITSTPTSGTLMAIPGAVLPGIVNASARPTRPGPYTVQISTANGT